MILRALFAGQTGRFLDPPAFLANQLLQFGLLAAQRILLLLISVITAGQLHFFGIEHFQFACHGFFLGFTTRSFPDQECP